MIWASQVLMGNGSGSESVLLHIPSATPEGVSTAQERGFQRFDNAGIPSDEPSMSVLIRRPSAEVVLHQRADVLRMNRFPVSPAGFPAVSADGFGAPTATVAEGGALSPRRAGSLRRSARG